MESTEIINQLTKIWRFELDDNDIILEANTTAKDVKGWDSLTNIQLIFATERKFKVRFTATEIMNFQNIGDLADLVLSKLS